MASAEDLGADGQRFAAQAAHIEANGNATLVALAQRSALIQITDHDRITDLAVARNLSEVQATRARHIQLWQIGRLSIVGHLIVDAEGFATAQNIARTVGIEKAVIQTVLQALLWLT